MVESKKKLSTIYIYIDIIVFLAHLACSSKKWASTASTPSKKNSWARASRKAHKELSKFASKTGLKASKKINLRWTTRGERRDVGSLDFCWLQLFECVTSPTHAQAKLPDRFP